VVDEANIPKPGAYRPVLCSKCGFPLGIKGTQPARRAMGYEASNRIYEHDDQREGMGCQEMTKGQEALKRLMVAHQKRVEKTKRVTS
jgi:hypothetical protein